MNMDIGDDARLEINRRIEAFLARGNPRSFLVRMGIMTLDGSVDYERARDILHMTGEMEEEIRQAFEEEGFTITDRPPVREGFISGPEN